MANGIGILSDEDPGGNSVDRFNIYSPVNMTIAETSKNQRYIVQFKDTPCFVKGSTSAERIRIHQELEDRHWQFCIDLAEFKTATAKRSTSGSSHPLLYGPEDIEVDRQFTKIFNELACRMSDEECAYVEQISYVHTIYPDVIVNTLLTWDSRFVVSFLLVLIKPDAASPQPNLPALREVRHSHKIKDEG